LGDTHYNTPDLRRIFHKLRSQWIEPFNGMFVNVFKRGGQVPVKGLHRTQLVVLGAVLLYQWHYHQLLGVGVKAFLRAARFMTTPWLTKVLANL